MRRSVRVLVGLVLVLLVVMAGALAFFRTGRRSFSTPDEIRTNFAAVKAAYVWIYAARAGREVVLFDTGIGDEGHAIDALLLALGAKQRSEVQDVFLTHGHPDHAAGAALFPWAHLHAGEGDVAMIAGHDREAASPMKRVFRELMPRSPPARVSDPLTGTIDVSVGEGTRTVRAIPVPGHTPGSYVYLYDGILIAGDTMNYRGEKLERSPAFFDSDRVQAGRSVLELIRGLAGIPIDRVCTGHGGCTPAGQGTRLLQELGASLAN
jgi:hydroxyacylglutathione hydrolase